MKNYNPAEEGIQAAKEDARKREFLKKLCDEFKDFVLDSAADHSEHYEDHMEFLKDAMETFIDLKNDQEEGE